MIPQLIQESVKTLKEMTDNVEELALLNILNAKIAHLVSLKSVSFKQYNNSVPRTLAYYGMNFMNSGANKDFAVDCINNYFLPFVEEWLKKNVEEYKIQYEQEQSLTRTGKREEQKIQEEINRMRVVNLELMNPNYTGLYEEARQMHNIQCGSLFIRIGELGDYLDNIVSGNQSKKELYQKLKDVYEGSFAPSIIAGDSKRETIKNIPVQVLMYTDFENLFNPKIKDYYLTSLKTGMARRSFIYMPSNESRELAYPKRPEEKDDAFYRAKELSKRFEDMFNKIQAGTVYQLSEEAKEKLYQYQCECIDYFNKSKDDIIIKLEHKESFWKITKLAVVYSIVDNPLAIVVSSKYVDMAISFYKDIAPSLKTIIEKRKPSEIELYAQYMIDHADEIITRTELRNTNIVSNNKFKRFFDEHIEEIKEVVSTYGYRVFDYSGDTPNSKGYQLMRSN